MTIRTRGTLPVCAATVVVTLAGLLSRYSTHGAQAVTVDRGSRDYTLPDQMRGETPRTARPRVCTAILKAGLCATHREARPKRVEQAALSRQ